MSNKVDGVRKNKKEISLLQQYDDEDLLLKRDVEAVPEPLESGRVNIKQDELSGTKCCRVNCKLLLMYSLLAIVSLSLIYFNLQIYKQNINHRILLNTSLNSTKMAISERETGRNYDINRYVQNYSQLIQIFQMKLSDLEDKLQEIKKDQQYALDKIQLLSLKNVEDLEIIKNIQSSQKKYASDIKEFHNELQIKSQQKFFVFNNQHQDMTRIESIVWVFKQNYEKDDEYLRQLYLNNVKAAAYKSSFEIKFVTKTNYLYFLSAELLNKISSIFKVLEKRLGGHDRTNLGDHIDTIKKILIMVAILYQHGGVILIDNIALTQPLNWLQNPALLKSFDHFDNEMPPQVISFHNYYYSDQKVSLSSQFKQIYAFPNIERYFLASIKKSQFVNKLIDEMIYILNSPATIKDQISSKYKMGILKGDDPYYEFFYIAGHLVIQKKQKQLDSVSKLDKKLYAIDYYGLHTFNAMVGPTKLRLYFKSQTQAYINANMMDIKRSQFQQKAGQVRFIHFFEDYQQANQLMLDIKQSKRRILKQSFIYELFFSNEANNQRYLYDRNEQPLMLTKNWTSLPKKVWIYLSEHSNNQISKLIIQNNFKMSKQSGFQVLTVNSKTIAFYLSKDVMNDVIDKFRKSRYGYSQSLRDYTLMLCLLSSQGGVLLDQSYLFLDGLNWLQNVNQIKPQFINNRIGETPKMLLFHNLRQRKDFNYNFDQNMHSRADNHVIFQKSFIAVESDSLIIDELIEQILKAIYMNQEQLDQKFRQCGIKDQVQFKRDIDLLPMDLLKCIYINGIKEATSQDYVKETNPYNIWSLDGDFSIYKLRNNTNYQNVDKSQNTFLTNFAMYDVEQRIGPFFKIIKLDQANINFLNSIYGDKADQPYKRVHKQSLFSRYFLIKN